jgi:MFS family permease
VVEHEIELHAGHDGRVRELLRQREFRLLFAGQSASAIGDRMVFVALALYVTEIGSPSEVGLVLAAHALPLVGFVILGGVWADRLPRHRLMLGADLARFALQATLAGLILAGAAQIWMIVVLEALFGTAEAVFRPAYTGLIPQTVPDALIQPAKAATSLTENAAQFIGPALATALVFGAGAGWAFAVDAATFLVSAAFLIPMRPRARGEAVAAQRLLADLRDGWSAVRERRWVWMTISAFSLMLLTALAPWFVLGPTVAGQAYGDRAVYGILTAVQGVGTLLAAVLAFRWRPRRPLRTGLIFCLLNPLAYLGFALGAPLELLVPVFVAEGAGFTLLIVWWETALAERIPPHLLSRVTSYDWMGSLALLPVGYLLAGPLASWLGPRAVLAGGSVLALGALAAALAPRETRELARQDPAPALP